MKILAIRFSALGDVAMTAAVIREILEQHPELEIDVLTKPFTAGVYPDHPRLRIIPADVSRTYKGLFGLYRLYRKLRRDTGYVAVADLHNVLRSKVLTRFFRWARVPVATVDKGRPEKKALTRKKNKVRGPLKPMTERYADVFRTLGLDVSLSHAIPLRAEKTGIIGFAPTAQHREKRWPERHARAFLALVSGKGQVVHLLGGPHERKELELLGRGLEHVSVRISPTGLRGDLEALRSLDLVVSMDSANMHLASLAGTPVVSIWGATHPDAGFMGYGQDQKHAVQIPVDELTCRPCSVFGNVPCHRGDWACLERLEPEQVWKAVQHALEENKVK